jgi:hypothetical protein
MMRIGLLVRALVLGALAVISTGCASIKMVPKNTTRAAPTDQALVTFVRQSIYMGDGIPVDLWDGEHYIGVLKPGTAVQYLASPGEHLFLAHAENWSYANGSLVAGKRYYVKANIFPGFGTARVALGVAFTTDERIDEWHKRYKGMAAPEAARAAFETEGLPHAQAAIKTFKDGKVTTFAEIGDAHMF